MISSPVLLIDLKKQLRALQADLTARSLEPDLEWAQQLRTDFERATARKRTARAWVDWRDGQIDQAAVAWLISSTFIRFCEDNHLLDGARDDRGLPAVTLWLAGPGDRLARAVENQTNFYRDNTSANTRDWLTEAFAVLSNEPSGRALVDREHNPVWSAPISAEAAKALVDFWRAKDSSGALIHDFTDPALDTRFLGDLYQDLSEYAKKTYALLQTPEFVEEFILDQTLTPAIDEFGISGLKLIDPTCGSGHFLLGAFARLNEQWQIEAPNLPARDRVRRAMDSIHGVDLNPFAVAIARFRLTVAGLQAAGDTSLVGAPAMGFHLAVGDSLLGGQSQDQGFSFDLLADDSGDELHEYSEEDLSEYKGILDAGRYHVVVGNPPYIQVKDKMLNARYREHYPTCSGKYALSVPFMELFFQLARREGPAGGAGYVGKITSNSFMKREFGKKLIEVYLAGKDISSTRNNPVDLLKVIDTSGAYIPGHGTPTVILVGRPRRPSSTTVRAVLGVRGEPGQPTDAAKGLVWTETTENIENPSHNGTYVTVTDLPRESLSTFPWSLTGGGAGELMDHLALESSRTFASMSADIGMTDLTGEDDCLSIPGRMATRLEWEKNSPLLVEGNEVRDYTVQTQVRSLLPVALDGTHLELSDALFKWFWRAKTNLRERLYFGKTPEARGLRWYDHAMFFPNRHKTALSITFAFVATHNHFVLGRSGKAFNRTAPVIKLPAGATEDDHLQLLAILNSSTACFWLKQVSHNKGDSTDTKGARVTGDPGFDSYEFTGTKLQEFPLPSSLPLIRGQRLDELSQVVGALSPRSVLEPYATFSHSQGEPTAKAEAISGAVGVGPTKEALGRVGASPGAALTMAREEWTATRAQMIFEQEELDWETYALYNLIDEDLTYHSPSFPLALGERAFEIALARKIAAGEEESAWFDRHHSTPITVIPSTWPQDYRDLVQRRLDAIESTPFINLLERPENKRRWATAGWDAQVKEAAQAAVLDRLEAPDLWRDTQGPITRSVAQLADLVRNDETLRELLEVLAGSTSVDLVPALTKLMADEAVPHIAAQRYKPAGVEKFREWQRVWDLQRAEDRGEDVSITVPPKYAPTDFLKVTYWKARGKLDVPKERFISYPGAAGSEADSTPVLGWAGWDHAEQGIALSRLIGLQTTLGAEREALIPLLAGLHELEPWLHQWHAEVDSSFGVSPASAISGLLEGELGRIAATRGDLLAWRPPAATRGRRATAPASPK